jgi:hypothetical protein
MDLRVTARFEQQPAVAVELRSRANLRSAARSAVVIDRSP